LIYINNYPYFLVYPPKSPPKNLRLNATDCVGSFARRVWLLMPSVQLANCDSLGVTEVWEWTGIFNNLLAPGAICKIRCRSHYGLSTGLKMEDGRERVRQAQLRRWK
jgi:hypothetical protein